MGTAILIKLKVGIPIEGATIILLPCLRRVPFIVGMVEIFLEGETMKDITTIAIGDTATPVGVGMQGNIHTRLVALTETL